MNHIWSIAHISDLMILMFEVLNCTKCQHVFTNGKNLQGTLFLNNIDFVFAFLLVMSCFSITLIKCLLCSQKHCRHHCKCCCVSNSLLSIRKQIQNTLPLKIFLFQGKYEILSHSTLLSIPRQIQNTLGLTVKSQQTLIHQMTSAIFSPSTVSRKAKKQSSNLSD